MYDITKLRKLSFAKQGVYILKNIATGQLYVGSSNNLNKRKNEHYSHLNRNCHENRLLQESYNKWGKKNFQFIVLEFYEKADKEFLYDREEFFMKKYKDILFNLSTDPRCVRGVEIKHTEESKKKISEWQKKKPPISEATRKKLREAALRQWERQKLIN